MATQASIQQISRIVVPDDSTIVRVDVDANTVFSCGSIPESVTELEVRGDEVYFEKGSIPSTLRVLVIPDLVPGSDYPDTLEIMLVRKYSGSASIPVGFKVFIHARDLGNLMQIQRHCIYGSLDEGTIPIAHPGYISSKTSHTILGVEITATELIPIKKVIKIKVTNPLALVQVFKTISNFVSECCLSFNEGGIKLAVLDECKQALVKLQLKAKEFDHYYCEESSTTIGIDISKLNSVLGNIDTDHPITLYMETYGRYLYINHSGNSGNTNDIKIQLLCMSDPPLTIRDIEFDRIVRVNTTEFKQFCTETPPSHVFRTCKITCCDTDFSLSVENGRQCQAESVTPKLAKAMYEDTFDMRYFQYLSDCKDMCKWFNLYIKHDYPIALVIPVSTLGTLTVLICPRE